MRSGDLVSELLGLLLPLGLGAAISPVPTATCLMLLSTNRRPLATATAFLIGSSAVLVAVGGLSLAFFGDGGGGGDGRHTDVRATIDTTFGGLFLVLAFKLWLKTPDPNAPPPGWLAAIGSAGRGKALLFGVVMMATNFSSLPLYLSGLKEIVTASVGVAGGVVALALFILLVEAGLLVPITAYALSPQRAGAVLGSTLRWIEKNNRAISIFVFAVFGTLLLTRGVAGFWGGP